MHEDRQYKSYRYVSPIDECKKIESHNNIKMICHKNQYLLNKPRFNLITKVTTLLKFLIVFILILVRHDLIADKVLNNDKRE